MQAVTMTRSQISVATTGTQLVGSDPTRAFFQVQNQGADPVILAFDAAPAGSDGIKIAAGGEWTPNVPPSNAVYAKSLGVGAVLVEVIKG